MIELLLGYCLGEVFVLGKENEVPWKMRADKEQFVSDYGERLKKKPDFILAEYKGLTAAEMSQLRKKVKEVGFSLKVVKNTLMKIIMGTLTFEAIKEYFKGPTAIIYGGTELNVGAKILAKFSKENEKLQIKAGMLSGSMITAAQVKELATLPSREVLLGKMCGVLNGPITGLAMGLNGIIRSLAIALDAVVKKKEK